MLRPYYSPTRKALIGGAALGAVVVIVKIARDRARLKATVATLAADRDHLAGKVAAADTAFRLGRELGHRESARGRGRHLHVAATG